MSSIYYKREIHPNIRQHVSDPNEDIHGAGVKYIPYMSIGVNI